MQISEPLGCAFCGNEVDEKATYCDECGMDIENDTKEEKE